MVALCSISGNEPGEGRREYIFITDGLVGGR